MTKFFGTDGIRAVAGQYPLTPEMIIKIAQSTAKVLKQTGNPVAVIGKDTRLSGDMIESAFTAGLLSQGVKVLSIGVMPTPAVSRAVPFYKADFGVMISASHNPFYDNGIKLFGKDGLKLSDEIQNNIESLLEETIELVPSKEIGTSKEVSFKKDYLSFLQKTLSKESLPLQGLSLVVDAANGVQSLIAPDFLRSLGANVVEMNTTPDGININEGCGAVHPEALCEKVVETKADLGLCFDGDADRLIVSDEKGHVVDGDELIAVLADLLSKEKPVQAIVTTVMSNMGLEKYFKQKGISYFRSNVGDRYVMEKMKEEGAPLGGESSGHLILTDYTLTGDGFVAALMICQGLINFLQKNREKKASDFLNVFAPYPQRLENVRFENKEKVQTLLSSPKMQELKQKVEQDLADKGRLLLRASGTEPLIRVMIEAEEKALLDKEMSMMLEAIQTMKNEA